MAYSTLSFTMKDYDNETAVVSFNAVEYNALTYADYLTQIGIFRDRLSGTGALGISQGKIVNERQNLFVDDFSKVRPTDENFLRGRKWQIRYQDNVTFKVYRCEIPCARVSTLLLLPNSDKANLTAEAWTTFITAFQDIARSPEDNLVTVIGARLVGRKLKTTNRR